MNDNAGISTPVRTVIADDHPLVLLAIENLVLGYPNLEIVGRAADATELFHELDRNPCDLVLMDLYMPDGPHGEGLETVKQFKTRFPGVPVVVLTMETHAAPLQDVLEIGANGVVSKRDRIDLIHVAIVTVLAGEIYVGPVARSILAEATAARRHDFVRQILSRRELEVFTQYASGLGVTEIATLLGRSVKTISAQKCTAMRKLALNSDAELFTFALAHGVIPEARTRMRR